MIKELIIVRHGEAFNLKGEALTGGWTNSLLTEKGKAGWKQWVKG